MSTYDLIINEDFSEEIFRESYKNKGSQLDLIKILFQYPSIQLNKAVYSFANTLSLFSETVHFSLSINSYCILSKESFEKISQGLVQNMHKLVKLSLDFGDHCSLMDLSFFSIFQKFSSNLIEFSFVLGEKNIIDDEQFNHLFDFISKEQTLNFLTIKINETNCFTSMSLIQLSKSLFVLENLVELCIDISLARVDEEAVSQFADSLSKLKQLNSFNFIEQSSSLFFPGIQHFLRAVVSLINLKSIEIHFESYKLLNLNDNTQQFFEGISNLKYLQKLILKGFNLSQVDFGRINCSFLSQKETLEVLELDFDQISSRNGLVSFLEKDLQHLTHLKEFNLNISNHSVIQEAGFVQISECISKMISLEKLKLSIQQGNRIGEEGFYSLGNTLTHLSFLSHLDLFIDDQNDQEMNSLKDLFEGIKCLTNLTDFRFKIICKESTGSSQICSFLGETLKQLRLLKILELFVETKYIYPNNIKDFCSGLQTLIDLRDLRVYFLSSRLEQLERLIFQSVQNFKQLEILRVTCNEIEDYEAVLKTPMILGRFEYLTELRLSIKIGSYRIDTSLIKQGFESMKQLRVLSLQFIVQRFYLLGKKMDSIGEDFLLPSSVEDLTLELKSPKASTSHSYTYFHKMFRRLSNLKVLHLDFDHKVYLHTIHDISKCLMLCQSLVCLSLKYSYLLKLEEIEYLSEGLSSLTSLRELELNIPNVACVEQIQTQQLKNAIMSLKNLYKYNENTKLLGKSGTSQYDHLLKLSNLIKYNQGEQRKENDNVLKINHLVRSKYDCRSSKDNVKQHAILQDNNYQIPLNLTELALTFFSKMTPLCYIQILENLKHFQNLKDLSFNFCSLVYLSRDEVSHIRIGLSQLINLTTLSVKCDLEDHYFQVISKKMIYAIGVSLQKISKLENLTLEIVKNTDTSYSNYLTKLAQGIKNQKKLADLELKLNGLNWLEWQSFNLKDVLLNTGKLRTLKLSFSQMFTEINLIQLGEALIYQNQLITLQIALNSQNSINTEAALSINKGIKHCRYLMSITIEVTNSNTGDNSSLISLLDAKNDNFLYLEEFNVKFLAEGRISSEIFENEITSIESYKRLKKLQYTFSLSSSKSSIKPQNSISNFFKSLFNAIQQPSQLSIECNLPKVQTNLKIITNNHYNYEFQFEFDDNLLDRSFDVLAALSQNKCITKLKCAFPQYLFDQSIGFEKNSSHLQNIQEFRLLANNKVSQENIYDNFALGIKQMVNLQRVSLYFCFQRYFHTKTFDFLVESLITLKHLSSLKIYAGISICLTTNNDIIKQSLKAYFKLSQLNNLKYLNFNSFDHKVSSLNVSRYLKRKMLKLVHAKLTSYYYFDSFQNVINAFYND